ncbi:MAG TPA: ATP-binding protein [Thermoleophilaceae bacterium]|nr:ATP-binding protein [Thermoleophilaceae bacterium]
MVEPQQSPRSKPARRRPSLARSLTAALVGLTLVLAFAAAAGIGGIYSARQDYEDTLARAYALESASSSLFAAGVVQQAALRDANASASLRRRAREAYAARARRAQALAADDPRSLRLVRRSVAIQERIVRLSRGSRRSAAARNRQVRRALQEGQRAEAALVARQTDRRAAARDQTRDDTRSATLIAGGAGLLALLGAVGLVLSLAGTIRRPLDELVEATRRLAAGHLDQRVEPGGPREIQQLDASFNEMAERLQEAQVRLEAERASLALTIESLGDALVVTDRDGKVTAANPRAAELVPTLAVGADAYGSDSPLPDPDSGLAGDVAIEAGDRTLAATAGRVPGAGPGAGLVWTIRDVSERARLERMKSDFVATASHELRSPLTSIKGFVELLGRSDALGEREREFVDVVLQSTDRLVDLVNDLLDVARLEAGRMEIHARLFDVTAVIEEVATLMGPRMEAKDQQLVLDLPPGLPKVLADPVRVRQILTNLISNAHLYTDEGGKISVIADGDGHEIELSVADDGRGMTQEDLDRVFDRFVRRDEDSGGGTGLGLAIVRSLVDLQGGTVDVRSQVGEGTVFTVRLPAEGSDSQASRRAVGGRKVLVATSRPETGSELAAWLVAGGAEASVLETTAPALDDLRRERYDVLLLDVEGLGEPGLRLLADLRDDPDLGRRPLVVVCAPSQDNTLAGEWRVRADDDVDSLTGTLGAAIVAERSSILVVGRSAVRDRVEAELLATGLDHEWATTGTAAAQACRAERFEVALVDAGMRAVGDVLGALDLRGARTDKAVIVFVDPDTPAPEFPDGAGVRAVVSLEQAGAAVVEALADPQTATLEPG